MKIYAVSEDKSMLCLSEKDVLKAFVHKVKDGDEEALLITLDKMAIQISIRELSKLNFYTARA